MLAHDWTPKEAFIPVQTAKRRVRKSKRLLDSEAEAAVLRVENEELNEKLDREIRKNRATARM